MTKTAKKKAEVAEAAARRQAAAAAEQDAVSQPQVNVTLSRREKKRKREQEQLELEQQEQREQQEQEEEKKKRKEERKERKARKIEAQKVAAQFDEMQNQGNNEEDGECEHQGEREKENDEDVEVKMEPELTQAAFSVAKPAAKAAKRDKVEQDLVDVVLTQLLVDHETHPWYASNYRRAAQLCEPLDEDAPPMVNVMSALEGKAAQLKWDPALTKAAVERVRTHALGLRALKFMDGLGLKTPAEYEAMAGVLMAKAKQNPGHEVSGTTHAETGDLVVNAGSAGEENAAVMKLKGLEEAGMGGIKKKGGHGKINEDDEDVKNSKVKNGTRKDESELKKKVSRAHGWSQALWDREMLDGMTPEECKKYLKNIDGDGEDFFVGCIMTGLAKKAKKAGTRLNEMETYKKAKGEWDEKNEMDQNYWHNRVTNIKAGYLCWLGHANDDKIRNMVQYEDVLPSIETNKANANILDEIAARNAERLMAVSIDIENNPTSIDAQDDYMRFPKMTTPLPLDLPPRAPLSISHPKPRQPAVSRSYPDHYRPGFAPREPRADRQRREGREAREARQGDEFRSFQLYTTPNGRSWYGGYGCN